MSSGEVRIRRAVLLLLVLVGGLIAWNLGVRSGWHRDRLLQRLEHGTAEERSHAAALLAQLGAEDRLLLALQSPSPKVRAITSHALSELWRRQAGSSAYQRLSEALDRVESRQHEEARALLDQLLEEFPHFVEACHARGLLHFRTRDYSGALEDARRATRLNPGHYHSWQLLALAQLYSGDVNGAIRSLRVSLEIHPHDAACRGLLRRCLELQRRLQSWKGVGQV